MEVKQVKVTAAAAEAATSSWSELPADLIGQVLLRLPSLADRVRLRAACRPWRTDAKRQAALPPPLPWFALRDGGLVDHHGAPVRRCAPILREGVTDYLAVDNLAFLAHNRAACCSMVNPLSASEETPLPQLANAVLRAMNDSKFYTVGNTKMPYVKVILSSPPLDSSPDPLVAALIFEGYYVAISACKRQDVAGFGSVSDWTRKEIHRIPGEDYRMRLADIAFLNGRLYALTVKEGLYVFEPNSGDLDDPMNAPSGFRHCIIDNPEQQEVYTKTDLRYVVARYLAECDGRLFMVRRWMRIPLNVRLGDMDETFSFEVFEADLTTTPCQWRKVDRLGGHAIFLGSECTKVVRASKCVGGVQEDCIYFMHRTFDNPSREYFGPCVDPLGDSGVYNMTNRRITLFLPEAVMEKLCLKRQFLTWFFPADV